MVVGQGHWTGLKADPDKYWGFIYIIRDLTSGYKYVGKKQYWKLKRGEKFCKSRVFDKGSPRWKENCWTQSDWQSYKGSSQHLKDWIAKHKDHVYEFEILHQARSKGVLSYLEVREQWDRRVLDAKTDDGEFVYFNRQISAIKFRPPAWYSEVTKIEVTPPVSSRGHQVDNTTYLFYSKKFDEHFEGTRYEFTNYTSATRDGVTKLLGGRIKTTRGWCLVKEVPHGYKI